MNPIFGERWDAPAAEDAPQAPTPVGVHCLDCDEAIIAGDQGFLQVLQASPGDPVDPTVVVKDVSRAPTLLAYVTAVHQECRLLHTVGHTVGVCNCTNWAGHGQPSLAAAKEAWQRIGAMAG